MPDKEIKVPNIGDFKDVEVIEILVLSGQSIKKNDTLITIESDKSTIEIPSSFNGIVKSLNVKVGDKVSEGSTILVLDLKEESKEKKENLKIEPENEKKVVKTIIGEKLVQSTILGRVLASPKTRKFARELGVNINQIKGSERQGRVLESDIKNFISSKINTTSNLNEIKNKIVNNEYGHSDFGETEIKDIPRVKKIASSHLVNSWNTIPHVTNHDEADITEMEDFRTSLTDMYTGEKKKITPLAFIIKALVASLRNFPNFNSSIDDIENGKITIKKYYHIGIAVDTPHGLMVPKIRNVNNKNINFINNEIKEIVEKCKKLKIDKKNFLVVL